MCQCGCVILGVSVWFGGVLYQCGLGGNNQSESRRAQTRHPTLKVQGGIFKLRNFFQQSCLPRLEVDKNYFQLVGW